MKTRRIVTFFVALAACILLYKMSLSIATTNYVTSVNRITSGQKSFKGIIARKSDHLSNRVTITGNVESIEQFNAFLLELQQMGKGFSVLKPFVVFNVHIREEEAKWFNKS
jgi:hypothetical protein